MLIGISAPPASGKTFSMRNLNSSKLAILNTDMKKIPKNNPYKQPIDNTSNISLSQYNYMAEMKCLATGGGEASEYKKLLLQDSQKIRMEGMLIKHCQA